MTGVPVVSFLVRDFPTVSTILSVTPVGLLVAAAYLHVAASLKRDRGWPTGYTRKVFHFLVFGTAAAVQVTLGVSALLCFGAAVSAVIFSAVLRGAGNPWFEAIARESDAPRRTEFVLVPYLATLIGGLVGNALFGGDAVYGYLVAGFGDAVGEPVGTRFGRHRYRVPSARGVASWRSVEGSAAVFLVSLAAVAVAVALRGAAAMLVPMLFIALVATLVEAASPHGWDNLTMQLVPAAMAASLLA
jgi:phytol kinase